MAAVVAGDAKAWAEEARRKVEGEIAHLEFEQMSLLLEIGERGGGGGGGGRGHEGRGLLPLVLGWQG